MNVLILEDSKERQKKFRSNLPFATIVETAEQCIQELQKATEPWDYVFLDHDLGFVCNNGETVELQHQNQNDTNTGSEVVRWLVKNRVGIKKIIIHSLNYDAAHEMFLKLSDAGYDSQTIGYLYLDFGSILDSLP